MTKFEKFTMNDFYYKTDGKSKHLLFSNIKF